MDPEEIGFSPMSMVQWLDYRQLVDTNWRVTLSRIFGAWADKRELQAALRAGGFADRSHLPEAWIDYVSDLADGFDPTYTVASLLATRQLDLHGNGEAHRTHRGNLLVMGGDQVYPTSKISNYQNRFLGPYGAALPCVCKDEDLELLALPGNHDWYDGLTSFMRIFCQGKHIGGWRTHQTRSYFAVKLPHSWWLWGIDVQLDEFIDYPQMSYFREVVGPAVEEGDRLILCTAKPVWVDAGQGRNTAGYRNLDYFERKVVQPMGARVMVYLSGDTHHYTRYSEEGDTRQRITAGGGGAFLHPTHWEPKTLDLPEDKGRSRARYQRKGVFPSPDESRRLRRRLLRLPLLNPSFLLLASGTYAVLSLLAGWFGEASRAVQTAEGCSTPMVPCLLAAHAEGLWSMRAAGGVAVLWSALVVFSGKGDRRRRWWLGTLHLVAHLIALIGLATASSAVTAALGWDGPVAGTVLLVTLAMVGGMTASLVMAAYLWTTDELLHIHGNETFSAMRITDYKNFLRLHIDAEGTLTIFPVGLTRVCSKWVPRPDDPPDAPWFAPADGALEPHLIEPPVRVKGKPQGAGGETLDL